MKIEDIGVTPSNWKDHGLGAINTLHVTSRELADMIRAMKDDSELHKIEGQFTLEYRGAYQVYLTLETEDT
jgi:hypothetical protein